jgi:hypothetical protein
LFIIINTLVVDVFLVLFNDSLLVELTKKPVEGFSAGLVDDSNIFEWQVVIVGPPDTPYEGMLCLQEEEGGGLV